MPFFRPRFTVALVAVSLSFAMGLARSAQTAPDEFTIIALPDTQFYSKDFPQIFKVQTQWIVNNREAMNIQLVLGLGDIVNGGGELYQWNNADAAVDLVDGVVPYLMPLGNHDYDRNDPAGRTGSTKNFNTYFGPTRYQGYSWYRGNYPSGSNENFYAVLQLGGRPYVILALEFTPRDEALQWASNIVQQFPDHDVIVVTHSYVYSDDSYVGRCDSWNAEIFGVGNDNDGGEMWEKFVSQHKNIVLVLNGHVTAGDGTGRRSDLGVNGNLVNQILSDYQAGPNGGDGYLRILKVRPSQNEIQVSTYSPWQNAYKIDSENQFTLKYRHDGSLLGSGKGAVAGRVRSIIDCSNLANTTVSYSGGSALADTNGLYSLATTAPGTPTLTVSKSGWLTQTRSVKVQEGLSSLAEFFLSTAGKVEGTVVNSFGTAVSAAAVRLRGGVIATDKTVYTNSTGFYSSNWIAVGDYQVTVNAGGYVGEETTTNVATGKITPLNFSLVQQQSGATISGKVTNAVDGSPLPGATVSYAEGSATTDTVGSYTLTNAPVGTLTVTASASNFQSLTQNVTTVSGQTATANFALNPGATTGSIVGKVTNASNGYAIPGVTVSYSGGSTITDANGNYNLSSVAPGTYLLSASKRGWGTRMQTVTVNSSATSTANFVLATSGVITGIVKNAAGAAIVGAAVTVKGGVIPTTKTLTTTSTGSYSSGWIPVGNYTVTVSKIGYGSQTKNAVVSTGVTTTLNFTLQ